MPSQYREFIPWGGKYAVDTQKEVPRPLLGGDKGRPPTWLQKEEKSQDAEPTTAKGTVSQEDFNLLLARVKDLENEVDILKKKC